MTADLLHSLPGLPSARLGAPPAPDRHEAIARARRHWLHGEALALGENLIDSAITRSWQRCLSAGRQPTQRVLFNPVSRSRLNATLAQQRLLRSAAAPVLAQLTQALASTQYFALLTDAHGQVIDTAALPASAPPAALNLARVGVDLSEAAVGTTAISLALAEQRSVWLHRAEHFFNDTHCYSCAGAPVFDAQGQCVGMLDLSGVDVPERPELQHLAQQAARALTQALLQQLPAALWLQFNWPGALGPAPGNPHASPPWAQLSDGLIALDEDGRVLGANTAARQLLPLPVQGLDQPPPHASELFALPFGQLFDAATQGCEALVLPLWSGLRLQARAWRMGPRSLPASGRAGTLPDNPNAPRPVSTPRLRELQGQLIAQAVRDAQGNVAEAARALGVSRATVYRQLGAARRTR